MDLRQINSYCVVLAAALGMSLASCSENDLPEQKDNTIRFAAKVQGRPAYAAGAMNVAVQANGTIYDYTLQADGSMTAKGEGIAWNNKDFDITAWTPVTDQSIVLTDQSTAEKLAACDLLAANGRATSHFVTLNFKHRMARVTWSFASIDENYTEEQRAAARVYFYGYGSTKFNGGVVAPEGNADQAITTYESNPVARHGEAIMVPAEMWNKPLFKVEIGGDEYVYTPVKSNESDLATAAGELTAGRSKSYYITISRHLLSVSTESSNAEWGNNQEFGNGDIADARLKADIHGDVTALPGYTVTGVDGNFVADRAAGFTISYTESALGGLTWEGTCKVTRTETAAGAATTHTYVFSDVKSDVKVSYLTGVEVGDYVYDNGTWGKDEAREGCKTVGRVFRVGLNDNDDSAYDLCKVRGYVAPVNAVSGAEYKWFANQSDARYLQALADIPVIADDNARMAYYGGHKLTALLTTALAPFSADWAGEVPFWNAFRGINLAAPSMSSGWYVPTSGQLKDVFASGTFTHTGSYLSSQVYPGAGEHGLEDGDKTILWAIRVADNQTETYGWAIDAAKLLPVLTF